MPDLGTRHGVDAIVQIPLPDFETQSLAEKRLAEDMGFGIRIKGAISPVNPGKDRLEIVILCLRDGIELVVMAAGTVDRGADKGGHGRHQHVVPIQILGLLLVFGIVNE